MDVLKLLSKRNVDRILKILSEHDEMYFGQIKTEIEINQSNLSQLLTELVENGYLEKRIGESRTNISKSYFKLTEKGKRALKIYEIAEELK
ncbi:DNA-binding HxlR family transcriptional regulator [Methanococcus maripaludis]|uniref:DNA-binding HxlR family transcriptional regulator n=1 Tax=Methanococcus maripaludis TaxID=39152 RepID=A0A7J9P749_METMI|nr:transcriptional regulator [Methanococcus maripaludis]MBA2858630.1 DNA-binding HxlR family transcriptional regulator [Methanococcus maripaludis]